MRAVRPPHRTPPHEAQPDVTEARGAPASPRPAWHRWLLRSAQLLLAVAVVWFAGTKLAGDWGQVRQTAANLSPQWGLIAASCLAVLVIYAILIEVWRTVLTAWNAHLPYGVAARIWTISNLGKYVPGKVWTIGTMMVMAQRHGVSAMTAGGSSLLTTAVATVAGFAVVALTGARVFPISTGGLVAIWLVGAALLALPVALPRLGSMASRLVGRPIVLPPIRPSVMLRIILGTMLSWCLYGIAFQLFTLGLLGQAPGSTLLYIAVFASSYLIGFLAVFAAGGLVVREGAMVTALAAAGVSPGTAVVLAVASRLWLTVLEISPALVFLAVHRLQARQPRGDRMAGGKDVR